MRSDGYILTNKHLVENAKKVMVTLWDRRIYEPTSIVTDDIMDLAMVKIEETGISALPYGDPNSIAVGDWVIALGHALGLSPLEGGATVTEGIISNLGRSFAIGNTLFYDVIQTSAAINVGNSGGPLINIAGEFIGLNSSGVVGAQNIGFAINAATVRHSFEDLVKFGKPQHPYLGVTLTDVNPCTCGDPSAPLGAKIATLGPGNPADKIGLRNNDIVTSFGGQKTDSAASLIRALWRHDPGDKVEIIFWRDGTMIKTDIVLTLRPSESNLI
jgi:serine protease Do